jgi:tellurite methyltransferase
MNPGNSVQFFDQQFQRQLAERALQLNPFEIAALPHLRGKVLDYGCGLGNLAIEAARRGCVVDAMDASPAAIEHIRTVAAREALPVHAVEADLSNHEIAGTYDAVVCIGLLMFFDCPTAHRQLQALLDHVRPGGLAIVNVLIEGTTYMTMFSAEGHCLFKQDELRERFAGWHLLLHEIQGFDAPENTRKLFATAIARKPEETPTDA